MDDHGRLMTIAKLSSAFSFLLLCFWPLSNFYFSHSKVPLSHSRPFCCLITRNRWTFALRWGHHKTFTHPRHLRLMKSLTSSSVIFFLSSSFLNDVHDASNSAHLISRLLVFLQQHIGLLDAGAFLFHSCFICSYYPMRLGVLGTGSGLLVVAVILCVLWNFTCMDTVLPKSGRSLGTAHLGDVLLHSYEGFLPFFYNTFVLRIFTCSGPLSGPST